VKGRDYLGGSSVVRKSARVNPAQPLKEFIEGASIECPASPVWCGSTNNGHSLRSYFPPRWEMDSHNACRRRFAGGV